MQIERLARRHTRAAFRSSETSLTEYLQRYALQNDERNVGRTFVATAEDGATILGYFTLAMGHISRDALSPAARKRLPAYPIPVALLGRLAVDVSVAGQGLGKRLLFAALRRALEASEIVAGYAVVVDALNEDARRFYLHFGFIPLEDSPNRLFLPTATIKAGLLPEGP